MIKWCSGKLFDSCGLSYAWFFSIMITVVAVVSAFLLIFTDRKEFKELYQTSNNGQVACAQVKVKENDIAQKVEN